MTQSRIDVRELVPTAATQAMWRDWPVLLRFTFLATMHSYRLVPGYWSSWLTLVTVFAAISVCVYARDRRLLSWIGVGWAVAVIVVALLCLVGAMAHVTWRLLSSDRVVILSLERDAVVDALVKDGRLEFSNHVADRVGRGAGRRLRGTMLEHLATFRAPARIVAPNDQVARLYLDEIAGLRETGRRLSFGRVELELAPRAPGDEAPST